LLTSVNIAEVSKLLHYEGNIFHYGNYNLLNFTWLLLDSERHCKTEF